MPLIGKNIPGRVVRNSTATSKLSEVPEKHCLKLSSGKSLATVFTLWTKEEMVNHFYLKTSLKGYTYGLFIEFLKYKECNKFHV